MDWTGPALRRDLLAAARSCGRADTSFTERPTVRYRSREGLANGWRALRDAGVPRVSAVRLTAAAASARQPVPLHAFPRLAERLLPTEARAVLERAAGVGAYAGTYHAARMFELIAVLERFRPASVLELGSGTSTGVFAAVHAGRFRSVEQAAGWIEKVAAIAPGADVVAADAVVETIDGEPVLRYDIDHAEPFDLVYVDGPANHSGFADFAADPEAGSLGCYDIELMWQAGLRPVVVIDGRRSTIRRLVRAAPDGYRLHLKYELAETVLAAPPDCYLSHTIMTYEP